MLTSAEFCEIAGDFGNEFEVFREALHNAMDWGATEFRINIFTEVIDARETLVIELQDNGVGMTHDVLVQNFWGLGNSKSFSDPGKVGEKGHGTKIFLKSTRIIVTTSDGNEVWESKCENAYARLLNREMHQPCVRQSDREMGRGTIIRIEGYNNTDDYSPYTQERIKDYLYWFTKVGTIENQFSEHTLPVFRVFLKALDATVYEELPMGHRFAEENSDIRALYNQYSEDAERYYVKKYVKEDHLTKSPHVKYQAVIYVEGDGAKRMYNTMLGERASKKGKYKVSDRYGIWLCKDYVPIVRVNDWISNFGNGSNSFVMLHGFINCQKLRLTANRGSVGNTEPRILEDLRVALGEILQEINTDMINDDIFTLKEWQTEAKTKETERVEFNKRKELISRKKTFSYNGKSFVAPRNESELYGLFMSLYTTDSNMFDFEPLDYDTNLGIDILARNRSQDHIVNSEYWYVELKFILDNKEFNHSFNHIRRIVCWDISDSMREGTRVKSCAKEQREFHARVVDDNGVTKNYYTLENPAEDFKIQIIPLKRVLEEKGCFFVNIE